MPTNTSNMANKTYIAAVEGGGTSFQVVICECQDATSVSAPYTILEQRQIDSSQDPHTTLEACAAFFRSHAQRYPIRALGIATFGPVGLRQEDPSTYGRILKSSPKAQWRNMDVLTPLQQACGITDNTRVRIETDVNAPAWAEYQQAKREEGDDSTLSSCAYITVGTGIGVGLVVNHQTVHGQLHPEGGHIAVPPLDGDTFGGYSWGAKCPYQGVNTVEGLASSVALSERHFQNVTGASNNSSSRDILVTLSDDDVVWDHAANALASLCVNLILTVSIERIVLGGGIMKRASLLEKIKQRTLKLLNGYVELQRPVDHLIVRSVHDAGLRGAIVLAQSAAIRPVNKNKDKQIAFGHGLWHGILVGSIMTAVVVKLLRSTLSKR